MTSSTSAGSRPRALDRVAQRVAAHRRAVGDVERALPALAQRRARGGDDDGIRHARHSSSVRGFRHTLRAWRPRRSTGSSNRTRTAIISGWSAESEQLFGWSRAEAIGMRAHRLIPERNRARHDAGARRRSRVARPARSSARRSRRCTATAASSAPSSRSRSKAAARRLRVIADRARDRRRTRAAEEAFRQSERFRAILDQIEDGCSRRRPARPLPVRQRRVLPDVRLRAATTILGQSFKQHARTRRATRRRSRSSTQVLPHRASRSRRSSTQSSEEPAVESLRRAVDLARARLPTGRPSAFSRHLSATAPRASCAEAGARAGQGGGRSRPTAPRASSSPT